MNALKLALDAIDPRLWYMSCGAFVWLIMYMVRRFIPAVWAVAVARNQAIPQLWMAVIGSLLALHPALGMPLFKAVQEVLVTALLATLGANGVHAFLRGIPGKYNGAAARVAAALALHCAGAPVREPAAPAAPAAPGAR